MELAKQLGQFPVLKEAISNRPTASRGIRHSAKVWLRALFKMPTEWRELLAYSGVKPGAECEARFRPVIQYAADYSRKPGAGA